MGYFRHSSDLHDIYQEFFAAFLADEDADVVDELGSELGGELTLRLRMTQPEAEIAVNLLRRDLVENVLPDEGVTLDITADADTLHEFWLGHLNSVEIARAFETGRLRGSGPPVLLAYLAPLIAAMAPHYRQTLDSRSASTCWRSDRRQAERCGSPDDHARSSTRPRRGTWSPPGSKTGANQGDHA